MTITQDTLLRQWEMLRQIPRYPKKVTARTLLERLETSGYVTTKRTIERDLQALSRHFPLALDNRSAPFGWSWQKDAAAIDVPALSSSEALSFMMVRRFLEPLMPASVLSQLAPYFSMAERCLSSQGGKVPTGSWLKKIAVVPAGQPLLPAPVTAEAQSILHEALLHNRQVRLSYQKRGDQNAVECVAHPLGLVQRGGVLYLIATLFDYDDARLLALHRVRSAELLAADARHPDGFDLDAFIAAGNLGFGQEQTINLVLRFSRSAGEHLWDTPLASNQKISEISEGRIEVHATVIDTPQLRWWLLGFAEGVEVIEPPSLRQDVAARLHSANRLYRQ